MKELVHIKASLYFRISDSELYGGVGSTGYSEISLGCDYHKINISDDYIKSQIENIAKLTGVPVEKIEMISKDEYDEYTEVESEE